MRIGGCTWGAFLLGVFMATPSLAQPAESADAGAEGTDAAAPEPPAPVSAPDVVMLKNGGLVRGTISELVPDDYVLIITVSGEQRRYPMADVSYAGAKEGAPTPSPPATQPAAKPAAPPSEPEKEEDTRPMVTVHAKEARVKLESTPAGMTFHKRTGSATAVGAKGSAVATAYDEMCTAPCEVSIPAGTHTLALSKPGGTTVEADPVAIPDGNSTLTGTYTDRAGTRTMGVVVMVAGAIAGAALILTANEDVEECDALGCHTTTELNITRLYLGMGVGVGGAIVGGLLWFQKDLAQITVTPGAPAARARSTINQVASADRLQQQLFPGLSLNARF